MNDSITLLVSSCDKYEDAWYPYFELIKKYWPDHPKKVALITESKFFSTYDLDIIVFNYPKSYTWSERLYKTLEKIDTKYVFFSLEDFFLLDYVQQNRIDECINWMEEDENIAVCRICSSNNKNLIPSQKYKDFYIADSTVGYRLDTQAAIWNREILMSFIDLSESPWEFEGKGSKRIQKTEKIFLWHYLNDLNDINAQIFSYQLFEKGYGISWGKWLWQNKSWFEKNGIYDVKYYRLGILSKHQFNMRIKYLYCKNPVFWIRVVRPTWKLIIALNDTRANIMTIGFIDGINMNIKKLRKKIKFIKK